MTLLMVLVICTAMILFELWREHRYDTLIEDAASRYGLDPLLVRAIIKRESNFRPQVLGKKGEIGLMQVTPVVGREYAARRGGEAVDLKKLCDPRLNIEVGSWYLSKAMRRYSAFSDPVPFALAHYNAGATNVDRWIASTKQRGERGEFIGAIRYPTTRDYVRFILRRWWWYKLLNTIGV